MVEIIRVISLHTCTKVSNIKVLKIRGGPVKMAQPLIDIIAPEEDVGLVLTTYACKLITTCYSKFRGYDGLFWSPREHECMWYM